MSPLDKANLRARVCRRSFYNGYQISFAMKNVLMIIGMFAVGCFACVAILVGVFVYFGAKYDASSKAFVDANVPPIISNWSISELQKRESDQFRNATTDDKLKELFAVFNRLGPMKTYDGTEGGANMNVTTSAGFQVTGRYVVNATFQNGKAEILVNLILVQSQWEILGVRVNAPALEKN
jgi:hypothetical protein